MASRRGSPILLGVIGGLCAFLLSALAALTALGPLLLGVHLIRCELQARRFAKIQRLEDLAAPGTVIGDALIGIESAQARVQGEGVRQALAHRSDGFYFEDEGGRADALNLRLAYLFIARQQLAHEFDHAAARWSMAISRRSVARFGVMLFIGAIVLLAFCEPLGAAMVVYGDPLFGPMRLVLSAAAVLTAWAAMGLAGRWAAYVLVEGLSALEPQMGAHDYAAEMAVAV